MPFPSNPTVGDIYTSARGYTYEYTFDGGWLARDNPILMAATPTEVRDALSITKYVTPNSLLLGALGKLNIHADVRSANNAFTFSAGTGNIVINGAPILWRGWKDIDTGVMAVENRTLTHVANKTYHIRWDAPGTGLAISGWPLGRFSLFDMADSGYNLGNAENASALDTTFDSILCGRLVTNGSNVATITPLANATRLSSRVILTGPSGALNQFYSSVYAAQSSINWGRTPQLCSVEGSIEVDGGGVVEYAPITTRTVCTRYIVAGSVKCSWNESYTGGSSLPYGLTGNLTFDILAV